MSVQSQFYALQAESLIKNLAKRNMEGYYFATKEEAKDFILSQMPTGSSISWGGSETIKEIGLLSSLETQNTYTLYDRSKVPADQVDDMMRQSYFADYYLMSSNAITLEGELVNIDGTGNRVSALIFGPKTVFIIAGMNKVVANTSDALDRIHTITCPQNALRLDRKTPCGLTGICNTCLSPDCMCMHTVITRNNRFTGRLKVVLVGESLGY